MEKKVTREYEVYHRLMRDAQVYTADSLCKELNPYDGDHWADFKGEPLIDIVYAASENEAVKIIEKDTGYHESNLYAIEHVVDAKAESLDGKISKFEASCYDDGNLYGIEIRMPNGESVLICNDRSDSKNKIMMGQNFLSLQN